VNDGKPLAGGPFAASGLVAMFLLLWLGFIVHRSPRFAGSMWGGVLAVSGAFLMLIPMAYSLVKRIPSLKRWITAKVQMQTILAWHIYTGLVGAILGLLHTGHKFDSKLGIALTVMMFVVVLSGFAGRYLLRMVSQEVREKKEELSGLEIAYRKVAAEVVTHPESLAILRPMGGTFRRLVAGFYMGVFVSGSNTPSAPVRALRLSESIADLEYAIKNHELLKRWFLGWLWVHIVASIILYGFLGLHIWASIHFGLRWFR
jgi:hypothetical protein